MVEDEDVSRKGISHGAAENQTFVILLRFDLLHPLLGKAQAKKIAIIDERTVGDWA